MDRNLIAEIYDCALEPEGWPEMLKKLGKACGVSSVYMGRELTQSVGDGENWTYGFDQALYDHAPMEIWQPQNSALLSYMIAAPLCQSYDRRTSLPDSKITHDSVGAHFLSRGDLHHLVLSTLERDADSFSTLMLGRSRQEKPFEDREIQSLKYFTDHLGRAMRIHSALQKSDSVVSGFSQALEAVSSGVLILNGNGRIAYANHVAAKILEADDGLYQKRGCLHIGYRPARLSFEQVLARLSVGSPDFSDSRIVVPRKSHCLPYELTIMPAVGSAANAVSPFARVLVFIADLESNLSPIPSERLQLELNLSAAEARIAVAAGEALPIRLIAERLCVSTNTVKFHLKAIYGKLGVRSQAELVRLIMARFATNSTTRK